MPTESKQKKTEVTKDDLLKLLLEIEKELDRLQHALLVARSAISRLDPAAKMKLELERSWVGNSGCD